MASVSQLRARQKAEKEKQFGRKLTPDELAGLGFQPTTAPRQGFTSVGVPLPKRDLTKQFRLGITPGQLAGVTPSPQKTVTIEEPAITPRRSAAPAPKMGGRGEFFEIIGEEVTRVGGLDTRTEASRERERRRRAGTPPKTIEQIRREQDAAKAKQVAALPAAAGDIVSTGFGAAVGAGRRGADIRGVAQEVPEIPEAPEFEELDIEQVLREEETRREEEQRREREILEKRLGIRREEIEEEVGRAEERVTSQKQAALSRFFGEAGGREGVQFAGNEGIIAGIENAGLEQVGKIKRSLREFDTDVETLFLDLDARQRQEVLEAVDRRVDQFNEQKKNEFARFIQARNLQLSERAAERADSAEQRALIQQLFQNNLAVRAETRTQEIHDSKVQKDKRDEILGQFNLPFDLLDRAKEIYGNEIPSGVQSLLMAQFTEQGIDAPPDFFDFQSEADLEKMISLAKLNPSTARALLALGKEELGEKQAAILEEVAKDVGSSIFGVPTEGFTAAGQGSFVTAPQADAFVDTIPSGSFKRIDIPTMKGTVTAVDGSGAWEWGLDFQYDGLKNANIPSPVEGTFIGFGGNPNDKKGFGAFALVQRPDGSVLQVSHLNAFNTELTPGQKVTTQDVLGRQGNSGTVLNANGRPVPASERGKNQQGVGIHADLTMWRPEAAADIQAGQNADTILRQLLGKDRTTSLFDSRDVLKQLMSEGAPTAPGPGVPGVPGAPAVPGAKRLTDPTLESLVQGRVTGTISETDFRNSIKDFPEETRRQLQVEVSNRKKASQISPALELQAASLAVEIFGKRAGTKPENVEKIRARIREGKTIDEIGDELRLSVISPEFQGPYKDAFGFLTAKGFSKDQVETNRNELDRILERGDALNANAFVKRLALDKADAQTRQRVEGRDDAISNLNLINSMINKFVAKGGSTGLVKGNVERMQQNILRKTGSPELAKIGNSIAVAIQNYRRSITGAAFTESEAKEYERVFPDIRNAPELNQTRINSLLRIFNTFQDNFMKRQMGNKNFTEIFVNIPRKAAAEQALGRAETVSRIADVFPEQTPQVNVPEKASREQIIQILQQNNRPVTEENIQFIQGQIEP